MSLLSQPLFSFVSLMCRYVNTMTTDLENCTNATVLSNTSIPIFVMTRDRVSSLRASLNSYWSTFHSPFEIIILDHNSTYPPMVQYLLELETVHNISVVSLQREGFYRALSEAAAIIQTYLDQHPSIKFWVFTDPDISFLRTAPDALLFYAGLLQSCPKIMIVGPGLQISDIPPHFKKRHPKRNESVQERFKILWTSVPNIATWNGLGYHVAKHPIDTTFAMRRRDERTFGDRLQKPTLRCYAPYAAVHVDWYDDSDNLSADKIFYTARQKGISHW